MINYKTFITVVFLILFVNGCGIMPKNVEYFQKKVETMPNESIKHQETKKQAADYLSHKTRAVLHVLIAEERSETKTEAPKTAGN